MNGASSTRGKRQHHREQVVNVTHSSTSSTVVPAAQTASRLVETSPSRWNHRNGHFYPQHDENKVHDKYGGAANPSTHQPRHVGTNVKPDGRADDVYGTVVDIRDLLRSKEDKETPVELRNQTVPKSASPTAENGLIDTSSPHEHRRIVTMDSNGRVGGALHRWESAPEYSDTGDTRVGSFLSPGETGRVSGEIDAKSLPPGSMSFRKQRRSRREGRQPKRRNRKHSDNSWILRSLEFEQFLTKYIDELEYQENAFQRRYTTGAGCGRHSRRRHLERYVRRAASAIKDANRLQEFLANSDLPSGYQESSTYKPSRAKSVPPRRMTPQQGKLPTKPSPSKAIEDKPSPYPSAKSGSYSRAHSQYRRPPTVEPNDRNEYTQGLPFGKLPIELSVEEYLEWEAQQQKQGLSKTKVGSDTLQHVSLQGRTGPVDALEETVPDIFWKDERMPNDFEANSFSMDRPPIEVADTETENGASKLNAVSAASTLIQQEESSKLDQLQIAPRVMSQSLYPPEEVSTTQNVQRGHPEAETHTPSNPRGKSESKHSCMPSVLKCWRSKRK